MTDARYPLVTVVGGSGFLGRHIVKTLARAGWRVRVLGRDAVAGEFLKTAGTVGQVVLQYADVTKPETLAGKFEGSKAVIYLPGILYKRGRQNFDEVHVQGARRVAAQASAAGAVRFIHISALGIERAPETLYGASKFAGEQAVRDIFPAATIIRPGLLIGPEDNFFQRFARMSLLLPFLPVIARGRTRFQPVLVTDIAAAVLHALNRDDTAGKTYELGGPESYTFRELLELMMATTHRRRPLINLSFRLASLKGFFCELLPFPPMITRDQVKLLRHDSVMSPGALSFPELALVPGSIAAAAPQLLARFVKR